METITFENVSFSYPGSNHKALDNINLRMENAEFIVVCGQSGCGKSTLLRQMKKNMIPYGNLSGKVQYAGVSIADMDKREAVGAIGYVQQNPENQIVTDQVWHELAFGLESLGYSNAVIRRKVAEMASFFGIQTWFRKSIHELSGGQKQLLNLASIMVMQPKVLILDEPTAQLDPIAANEFLNTLKKINNEIGTMIIVSEHRLEEVLPIADRVIVMEKGKVLIYDKVEAVGKYLTNMQGKQHAMFYGLPVVMRMYAMLGRQEKCPMTIREGKGWLQQLLKDKEIVEPTSMVACSLPSTEYIIEVTDVWLRYERDSEDILRGLNFNVIRGEWYALLGGNGVGKSTSMKAICGLMKPYRGKIRVNGKNTRLSMLPQNPQVLFTEITVQEELEEMLYAEHMSQEEKKTRILLMLQELELYELRDIHPYDLSGGEQQRLALGKILLREPDILILDEPTKGLDPFFKRTLAKILLEKKQQGTTILMVSHDIEFCAQYTDRCGMFFDGTIVSEDTTREFFAGNNFYTTMTNRIAREWFPKAITCEEVVTRCKKILN